MACRPALTPLLAAGRPDTGAAAAGVFHAHAQYRHQAVLPACYLYPCNNFGYSSHIVGW